MQNKIKLFVDGPNFNEINALKDKVDGFTFNPSLFKKLGAEDYIEFTKKILNLTEQKSVSIEVIGDDENTCFEQALKISKVSETISVKIPIIYTSGKSTINLIEKLISENIRLNITAIFTLDQIKVEKTLSHLALIKQSRLSVMSIDILSWKKIIKLSKKK